MTIDRALPGEKFLDRQRIALARFIQTEKTTTHRRDHFGLAANDPALGAGRRQVGERQRAAVGPDDITHTPPSIIAHHHAAPDSTTRRKPNPTRFKKRPRTTVNGLINIPRNLYR